MLKKILFLIAILMVIFALITAGCGKEEVISDEESIALNFLKNDPTFKFDARKDTLKLVSSTELDSGIGRWQFEYEFQSANLGYGDRSGDSLVPIVTTHRAQIFIQDGKVIQAMLDDVWDMLSQTRTKVRVMIQHAIPLDEGVYGLIRDLGGMVRNSYSYSNSITITMDIPEEAIEKLSSDLRVGIVKPADKLTLVIEFNPPLDKRIRSLIESLGGNITGSYLSNEGIIETELPEEAIPMLSSDTRIISVRPVIWGELY